MVLFSLDLSVYRNHDTSVEGVQVNNVDW
jgi:hypothetical protein